MNRYKKEKLLKEISNNIKTLFANDTVTLQYWYDCIGSSRQETFNKVIYTFSLKDIQQIFYKCYWRQVFPQRKFIKLALREYQNRFFSYDFIFNKTITVLKDERNKNI